MPQSALLAHDLARTLAGRRVLDGISLSVAPGRRLGVIGDNGIGKSTLLRLLAGLDTPDAGTIERPSDIGFLHQEMPFNPRSTIAAVLDDALRDSREDLAELDRLTLALAADGADHAGLLATYGERLERAQDHNAWDADRRADLALAGLGLAALPRSRRLGEISGGQRARLAVAALLVRQPSALLLDEPTNHLDDQAAEFLEQQLREFSGVVVLASHDRAFLDAVCTDLIDLDPALGGPTRFGGNYTDYLAAKQADRQRWEQQHSDEQEELRQLRHAVAVTARGVAHGRAPRDHEKMGYDHTGGRVQNQVSRRVRAAARRLADLERSQVRKPPAPLRFRAPAGPAPSSDGPLLSLRDVCVSDRLALDRLDVQAGERLLVTGVNGAGKSTLLAVMAGRLSAAGQVQRRRGARIGLLTQDTAFHRGDRTAGEIYRQALGAERAESVPLRSLGLIAPRDVGKPVRDLSAGQRRRLALALLYADPPDLLLLDEPTNHLSPTLANELEDAFASTPSAVVVASHDRWLRSRWAGSVLNLVPSSRGAAI